MFYSLGRLEEAERASRQALELQPDYLYGLWNLGVALCSLGQHDEAIQTLERAAAISRSPMFVGLLGLAYARAGRRDDATRLIEELEDRGSRGEYVPAFALLTILIGLGDVAMIRRGLAAAMAEPTPPLSLRANGGGLLLDELRTDSKIDRLLFELYGYSGLP
jgi:tetratricopeptide (TPR) repeat protein